MRVKHELVIKAEEGGEQLLFSKTGNRQADYQTAYKTIILRKDFGILAVLTERFDGTLHKSTHSIEWSRIGHPSMNPHEIFFYLPSGQVEFSISATRKGVGLDLTDLADDIRRFVLPAPAA